MAVGGGGIPVVEDANGNLAGAAAVIDKDLATSLLARELKADVLIISTAIEKVCLNYRKPDQRDIDRMTMAEAKQYLAEGHFAPGSMKPKIEAVIELVGGVEPARTFVERALRAGKHVVTANKALLAVHGPELLAIAGETRIQVFQLHGDEPPELCSRLPLPVVVSAGSAHL